MEPIDEKGWTIFKGRDEVKDLATFRGTDGALYSLWRPSLGERLRVLIGAPVVAGVLAERQPPITVKVGREAIPGLMIACALLLLAGCSPYAVRRYSPAEDKATLSSRGVPLVSQSHAGVEWHKRPNEVAVELMHYVQDVAKEQAALRVELENVRDNLQKCETVRKEQPVDPR